MSADRKLSPETDTHREIPPEPEDISDQVAANLLTHIKTSQPIVFSHLSSSETRATNPTFSSEGLPVTDPHTHQIAATLLDLRSETLETPLPLIPYSDGNESSTTPDDLGKKYLPRRPASTSDNSGGQSGFVRYKRRKRAAGLDLAVVPTRRETRPKGLPDGWRIEYRVRTGGATAGVIDKFYYDPIEDHQFRSLKEVEFYVKTGIRPFKGKKKNAKANIVSLDNSKPREANGLNWNNMNEQISSSNFDFVKNVRWVLTGDAERSKVAYVGDERVLDSCQREWATALASFPH